MNRLLGIVCLVFMTTLLSSCNFFLSKMYGVNNIKDFDDEKYTQFVSKIKEQIDCISIVSDSSQYKKAINLGTDLQQKKNFSQPVQILYFDRNKIKSYHINCYAAGSLTNVNWNTEDRFSSFLPKSAVNIEKLSVSLEDYNKIYSDISVNSTKRYIIIIFWTLLIEKISYSAIKTVIDNLNKYGKLKSVDLYLINSDKFFKDI